MPDIVIKVQNLSKKYSLGEMHSDLLSERIGNGLWSAIRQIFSNGSSSLKPNIPTLNPDADFWALRDVSFEVKQGEVVGIIGRNGAGKSTLLKILSKITPPTLGRVEMVGRVASLLEVGTGFHPELTGRENIFLNGAILGMTKDEIRRKFDEIVAFAEVEKFIDTPVKRYSSGMYVRLAFAVAAHLEPEILVVDEVLAVGDAQFQKKCLGKMGDVAKEGRTVLFVSHNMDAVRRLCQKSLVLREGRVGFLGETHEAIHWYLAMSGSLNEKLSESFFSGPLKKWIRMDSVHVNGMPGSRQITVSSSSDIVIRVCGFSHIDIARCNIAIGVEKNGVRFMTLHDTLHPEMLPKGPFCSEVAIPAFNLRPGEYSISFGSDSENLKEWMLGDNILNFAVVEADTLHCWDKGDKNGGALFTGRRLQEKDI